MFNRSTNFSLKNNFKKFWIETHLATREITDSGMGCAGAAMKFGDRRGMTAGECQRGRERDRQRAAMKFGD